jgi:tetratricopeptide (TPR) repeat protein
MKLSFTLLIILFIGLKLSASARYPDTAKIANSNPPDSVKLQDSLKQLVAISLPDNIKLPEASKILTFANHSESLGIADNIKPVLFVTHSDSLVLIASAKRADSLRQIDAVRVDSLRGQLKSMDLDALKQASKTIRSEIFKGPLYAEIATRYLAYDTLSNKKQRSAYQNEALNYTMLALHQYSMYNDTAGLRTCFDNLAKVYFAQKKYPQAKWFILQSNTLSRIKNDVPNIITSLLTLSAIKRDIKDYTLAMGDLNEALQLSITNKLPTTEVDVLRDYALLYSRLKNYPKEAIMLKKRDSVEESIHKAEDAKLLASIAAKDSLQKKKLDSLQNKKKVYTSNIRKPYKNGSGRKLASL